MSNRLDQDREEKLQPHRIEFAIKELRKLNIEILSTTDTRVDFLFKNKVIMFYPYSGWHTGKTITDGRGWKKLHKQLTSKS